MMTQRIPGAIRWAFSLSVLLLVSGCEREETGQAPPATEQAGESPSTPESEAAADQLIRGLSQRLAAAEAFTFKAERHLDPALLPGRDIAEDAHIEAFVKRPNKVYAVARTDSTVRHFYFDGQNVTVFDQTKNMYAVAPVSGRIDDMVSELDERFGFTPPLAEFLVSDVAEYVDEQVSAMHVAGSTNLNGKRCNRIVFQGENADGELWLSAEDQVPCGLQATFRDLPNRPQTRVTFSEWNLNADVEDSKFTFTPPAGARQIRMLTVEEVERAETPTANSDNR